MNTSAVNCLRKLLPGRVSEPDAPVWNNARQVFANVARERNPALVVSPAHRDEVARFVNWANETGSRFTLRSGGHAFDGFSVQDDYILLDLRSLNVAKLDRDRRLHAMPAVRVLGVSQTLEGTSRALPCGDCPAVGLGGLISGGGFGYASRLHGLTIDFLEQATVVCGDGSVVTASARENPDLFWACRGGGGCAGVVTDFRLRTFGVDSVTGITMGWNWEAAADAVVLHSGLMLQGPPQLDLKLKFRTTGLDRFMDTSTAGPPGCVPGEPFVHIDGQYLGHRDEAEGVLRPLLQHPGARNVRLREESYHDAVLQLSPLDIFRDPAPATLRPLRVASDFARGKLTLEDGSAIVEFVEKLQSEPLLCGGGVLLEPCNGAVRSVEPTATAFSQRNADQVLEWELFHDLPLSEGQRRRQEAVLTEVRESLAGRLTGGRYVNYPDWDDTPGDWWGGNLPRLVEIARRYDPGHVIVSRLSPARQSGG